MSRDPEVVLCGYPAGSEDLASSRIRYHALTRELRGRGIPVLDTYSSRATHLFIQKRITEELIEIAAYARRRGQIVVYDLDDLGIAVERLAPAALLPSILRHADLITVSTEGQRARLQEMTDRARVHVLPNCIDYGGSGQVAAPVLPAAPFRVLWFGYAHNTRLLQKYLSALRAIEGAELVVVTRLDLPLPEMLRTDPRVQLVAWSRAAFVDTLRSCHVSCLMHDGSAEDRLKSNVRMITSIAWGVPAAVSRTPDYEATAHRMGLSEYLFEGPEDAARALGALRSAEARERYLAAAQPVAVAEYAPSVIAARFLAILGSLKP